MRKIRFCFLSVAHVHTPTYVHCLKRNSDAEIIGFYDDVPARARIFAEKNAIEYFDDPAALFEKGPDVALVCSENMKRARWVTLAAENGVDILCEKPLGANREDIENMIDVCRAHGVKLMTAMCNRYIHSFREAAQAVRDGKIGRLLAVFASNKGTMPGGWFTDRTLSGGGCVIDHTVHVADMMNDLLGALPETVYAQAGHNLFEMDVEDCAVVTMRYPGDILVTLDASWSRTPCFPYGRDLTMRFVGTHGSIFVDYFAESNRLYAPGKRIFNYYGEDKDQMMMDELVACRQSGREFSISGLAGRDCALVAEAAYRSIEAGGPVMLDP